MFETTTGKTTVTVAKAEEEKTTEENLPKLGHGKYFMRNIKRHRVNYT